jgi:hypothetical protein
MTTWDIGIKNENGCYFWIGKKDMSGNDVTGKIAPLLNVIGNSSNTKEFPFYYRDTQTNVLTNTRGEKWVNFLIISEDKQSSYMALNTGIAYLYSPHFSTVFQVNGEFYGNNSKSYVGLVETRGPTVGTPRFCGKYKVYYALNR